MVLPGMSASLVAALEPLAGQQLQETPLAMDHLWFCLSVDLSVDLWQHNLDWCWNAVEATSSVEISPIDCCPKDALRNPIVAGALKCQIFVEPNDWVDSAASRLSVDLNAEFLLSSALRI